MSETVQVILAISFIILAVGTTVAIILSRRAKVKSKFFSVETEQDNNLSTMLIGDSQKINELYDLVTNLRIDIVRLELLAMLHHDPDNASSILSQYDKYCKLGGNGYIKHLINVWKKEKGIEE